MPTGIRPHVDFSVTYEDNDRVGTATAVIKGEGNWTGEFRVLFEIVPPSIADASYDLIPDQYYAFSPVEPEVWLHYDGRVLVEGEDYEVGYANNDSVGEAEAVVTGKGMFSGEQRIPFTIMGDISQATIGSISDQVYADGLPIEPKPVVAFEDNVLVEGIDYSLSYMDNSYHGVAAVTISGMGYYAGWTETWFNIIDRIVFTDVFAGVTDHASHIRWLADEGVSKGWDNGDGTYSYRPYSDVARADMAAFLYRLAGSPAYEPDGADLSAFSDVDASTPHYREVLWLASAGISEGWDIGGGEREFRSYDNIARSDMAAFLHRLAIWMGAPEPGSGGRAFSDVDGSVAHAGDVAWLAAAGITTGFLDGTFKPYDTIKRCDMAAMLHRLDGFVEGYEVA